MQLWEASFSNAYARVKQNIMSLGAWGGGVGGELVPCRTLLTSQALESPCDYLY